MTNGFEKITMKTFARSNPVAVFWLLFAFLVLITASIVFTMIRENRQKKKEMQLEKQLQELNEQLQAVIQQTDIMYWQYDAEQKKVKRLKNDVMPERYMPDVTWNVPEYFVENQLIHPDSRNDFLKMYGKVQAGVKKTEGVFCVRNSTDLPWHWEKVTYINRFDDMGNVLEAIGFANDVTLQMEREIAMRTKAEIDALTCVYDRHAFARRTDELVQDRREDHSKKVLCVCNIDDFHTINEHFGHHRGDQILREVADVLKEGCRQTDIIGRMNGDEFLILFLNVNEIEKLEKKVQTLLQRIRLIVLKDGTSLSASAGLTAAKNSEEIFEDLYQRAQEAMKEAKALGGNRFIIK